MANGLADSRQSILLRLPRRRFLAWCLFTFLQAVSVTFFVGDVTADFLAGGLIPHTVYEGIATIALFFGMVLGLIELFRMARRAQTSQGQLDEVTRSFSETIRRRFDEWALSPAEADVAMLLIKGFETSEIAALRQSAEGTVRAQLSKIYEKSGVSSRSSFVSSFVELLVEPEMP